MPDLLLGTTIPTIHLDHHLARLDLGMLGGLAECEDRFHAGILFIE
jgi:hypothetical protein